MNEQVTTLNNKQNLSQYFTPKHFLFYSLLIPPIISNYLIFNLVLTSSANFNILFNINSLLKLVLYFSITFSFAGVTLYFLKKSYEILFSSILLTLPILLVALNVTETVIASFASLATFFISGMIIRSKIQKYIIPNIREQVASSFKITTLLLNFSLTFIFFTQVNILQFDNWVNNINNLLAPITETVTREVEKSFFPQKQIIGQAQNLFQANLMELDLNQIGKSISINEIGGLKDSELLTLDQVFDTPSPTQIIKKEIKTALTPYQQYLPYIAAFLAFVNYQVVINISIFLSSLLIPILIFLLKFTKVIKTRIETREVQVYEI